MSTTEPPTVAPSTGVMVSRQSQPDAPAVPQPQLGPMQIDLRVAAELAKSDIVPKAFQGKASNILVAIGLGRSLGLEPAPSLYGMHVIEGTPSPTAKLQAALVRRAGHKLRILEHGPEKAVVQIVRCDDPEYPVTVTFTVDDARAAHFLDVTIENWVGEPGKKKKQTIPLSEDFPVPCTEEDLRAAGAPTWAKTWMVKRRENWFSNRATMLHHRAVTRCVGMACPEVVSGLDFEVDETIVAETPDPIEVLTPTPAPSEPATEPAATAAPADVVDAEIVPEPGADTPGEKAGDRSDADQPVVDGSAGADSPGETPEPETPPPAADPDPDPPAQAPIDDPNVLGDEYTGAQLTSCLKFREIRQANVLRQAAEIAESLGIPEHERPGTVQQIAGHKDVALRRAVAGWVNAGGEG